MQIREDDSQVSQKALSDICQAYWYPLYAYLRRLGNSPDESKDLVQGFFLQLLSNGGFDRIKPDGGKMRSFLLTALKRFRRDQWRATNQWKRGGRHTVVSIDQDEAEASYRAQLVDSLTPELAYERSWVMTLLQQTLERLREDYESQDKSDTFDVLKNFITSEAKDYDEVGTKLGLSASGVGVAVHRLRKRYREVLIENVADTIESRDSLPEEVDYLMSLFQETQPSFRPSGNV